MSLAVPLRSDIDRELPNGIHIAKADIILEPRNLKAWLIAQVLNINWSNVGLIITMLALSIAIKNDTQAAKDSYSQLEFLLPNATALANTLNNDVAVLSSFQNVSMYATRLLAAEASIALLQSQLQQLQQVQEFQVSISSGGSPVIGYTQQYGRFVQVGSLVAYQFYVEGSVSGTPSGAVIISVPVPMTMASGTQIFTGVLGQVELGGAQSPLTCTNPVSSPNTTVLLSYANGETGLTLWNQHDTCNYNLFNGGFRFVGSIIYFTKV